MPETKKANHYSLALPKSYLAFSLLLQLHLCYRVLLLRTNTIQLQARLLCICISVHIRLQKERLSSRNWLSSESVSHLGHHHHHTNCSPLDGKRKEDWEIRVAWKFFHQSLDTSLRGNGLQQRCSESIKFLNKKKVAQRSFPEMFRCFYSPFPSFHEVLMMAWHRIAQKLNCLIVFWISAKIRTNLNHLFF